MDSSTTSWPACTTPARARPQASSGPRSGSRLAVSGVGTQISTASGLAELAQLGAGGDPRRHRAQPVGVHVLDVGVPGGDRADLGRIDVHSGHRLTGLGERDREWKADVAQTDDAHRHCALTIQGGCTGSVSTD